MKNYFATIIIVVAFALTLALAIRQKAQAQNASSGSAKGGDEESLPSFVTNLPPGYRDWKLISVAREEGTLDDIRAILGNDIAIKAYREHMLPFPEGAIIARIAWS